MRGGNAFGECTLSALVFFAVIMHTGVEGAAQQRTCPAGDRSCSSGKKGGELALRCLLRWCGDRAAAPTHSRPGNRRRGGSSITEHFWRARTRKRCANNHCSTFLIFHPSLCFYFFLRLLPPLPFPASSLCFLLLLHQVASCISCLRMYAATFSRC